MVADERPRESLVKYDPPLELGPASQSGSTSGNKLKQQLSKKTTLPPVEFKPQLEDILHALLPPREWVESERNMIQYVSAAQATRLDVIQLQEALDHKLMERQARETGICPVREELYSQCFDELIRQICINCPERYFLTNFVVLSAAIEQSAFLCENAWRTKKEKMLTTQGSPPSASAGRVENDHRRLPDPLQQFSDVRNQETAPIRAGKGRHGNNLNGPGEEEKVAGGAGSGAEKPGGGYRAAGG
ncbi:unnamed protein product [Amoebophrya sp. A120]|nr:unnamed protein product [Amoebophrya sp. A120]|eukprot:GSA120T00009544001.1